MEVHVKYVDGSTITIDALNEKSTVHDLKEAIQQKSGIRPVGYHLVFDGHTLEEKHVLGEHGIKNGATITAIRSGLKD